MKDYHYQTIKSWADGIPFDVWGHALSTEYMGDSKGNPTSSKKAAVKALELTNPYGSLYFAVGSGDDFYCFDYAVLSTGKVAVHVTLNSETGSFIQDEHYGIHSKREAAYELRGWVDNAITWVYDNNVKMSQKGWNQDPWFVVRHFLAAAMKLKPFRDYTEKRLRFGKGKADRGFIQFPFACPKPKRSATARPQTWQVMVRAWVGQGTNGVLFGGARRNSRGDWTKSLAKIPQELKEYLGLTVQPGANKLVTVPDVKNLEFFADWKDGKVTKRKGEVKFTFSLACGQG